MNKKDYPELVKEWDYEKNANDGIFFDEVSTGSNKKVWWRCKNNHSFQRRIHERTNRHYGCPYCSGRQILSGFNDFATKYPELLTEWDYEKNNKLGIDPTKIGVGFRPKVWWICPKGHSYDSVIHPRTHCVGCPYCSNPIRKILVGYNDIATTNPEIMNEWDYEKNKISPQEISKGYTLGIYWKCKKNHSYKMKVITRIRGCGCPYCSNHKAIAGMNDLFTQFPALKEEWNYEKNTIDPTTIVRGGSQKFWWKCKRGHEWQSKVANRIRNDSSINQCPVCAKRNRISFPEKVIFYYIKNTFKDAVENYKTEWLGKKELDIFIPSIKVGIEYDGEFYHRRKKDIIKDNLCQKNGIKLIRIREKNAETLESSSMVYQITENGRADGKHLIGALEFLENQLDVDMNVDLDRDHDILRRQVENYEIENCITKTNPELLPEWDYEKNKKLGLTPDNVSRGTAEYIWWVCDKGHSYKATLSNRINGGTGCPYCSTPPRKILVGFNDLATTNPELVKRWDYKKNKIKPTEVTRFSNRIVWLICEKGHSYNGSLLNVGKSSCGCPYCSGHRVLTGFNDLATTHPNLLDEWDYERNIIKPTEVSKGHETKVYWKCAKGHSYIASPNAKTSKKIQCPYCSGQRVLAGFNDIATTNPEILDEWDYERNTVFPTEISKGSGKKIWLKCKKSHSYETTLPSRLSGHKCNYCSNNRVLKGFNDIATTDPYVLKVWDDGNYSPYELSRKSGKIINCKCPSCKHKWETRIYNLTTQKKCPRCKINLSDKK